MDSTQLHVAIVSSPGIGHLIPVLVLGNRLATHHNIKITILTITTNSSSPEIEFLKKFNEKKTIQIIPVPSVNISHLIDSNTKLFTQLRILVREALPKIRSGIASMNHRLDALIVDIFGTQILPIAEEFNIPKYVFHPTNAWSLALFMYQQVLDQEIEGEYVDLKQPLEIPGCKALRPDDVKDPMMDRSDQQYHEYLKLAMEYTCFDGILTNTWEELEEETIKALRSNEKLQSVSRCPIYPIGPWRRTVDKTEHDEVIQWLDKQNQKSTLYVSFESGGTLSSEQIIELAWGFELSQHKFVWVVRPPSDNGTDSAYLNSNENDTGGSLEYLPKDFLTRTKDMGLVIPMWAQQVEILSHLSVGGFIFHCGWNSTIESLTSGVPMIAWPLHAE